MVADELASMIDDDELARSKGMLLPTAAREEKANNRPSQQDLLAELGHTDWGEGSKRSRKLRSMLRPSQLW